MASAETAALQREWADVTPIPQEVSDQFCAQINYDPDFAATMDIFRAVLKSGEKTQRALELTEKVIEGNAANYTAWFYRRECLFALNSDLRPELELVTDFALNSPKNYQIWHHRRAIVDKLGDGSEELHFTTQILNEDSKNYHAWSHRQFALQRFNLWAGELDFVQSLLEKDLRNNSAWNQRWFVVKHTDGFHSAEVRLRELQYAFDWATKAPNNESPFNYIRGIMRHPEFDEIATVREFAEQLRDQLSPAPGEEDEDNDSETEHPCSANPPPLLALLVEVYTSTHHIEEALELCDQLAKVHDTIRQKYWYWKASRIHTMHHHATVTDADSAPAAAAASAPPAP